MTRDKALTTLARLPFPLVQRLKYGTHYQPTADERKAFERSRYGEAGKPACGERTPYIPPISIDQSIKGIEYGSIVYIPTVAEESVHRKSRFGAAKNSEFRQVFPAIRQEARHLNALQSPPGQ